MESSGSRQDDRQFPFMVIPRSTFNFPPLIRLVIVTKPPFVSISTPPTDVQKIRCSEDGMYAQR